VTPENPNASVGALLICRKTFNTEKTNVIYDLVNLQFSRMLSNLLVCLDKAESHATQKKFDVNVLAGSRLAPDQFDFTRQIQILCSTAVKCTAQLTGRDAPNPADSEKTIAELRHLITNTVQWLSSVEPAAYSGAAERKISQPRWEGQWLTGAEFMLHHAIPNFYFHMTTTYSILRHNGVDVGKKDYLGKMPFKK